MRKSFILLVALCSAVSVSAQEKGDKQLGLNLGVNLGNQKSSTEMTPENGPMTKTKMPKTKSSTFDASAEFGYFICDNVKVSLNAGWMFTSTATKNTYTDKYDKTTQSMFGLTPSVSYYYKLADKLYWTPEVGACFGWGNYKVPSYDWATQTSSKQKSDCSGWNIYGYLTAFEFRTSESFAIGVYYGRIDYQSNTYENNARMSDFSQPGATIGYNMKSTSTGWKFDLGTAYVSARFYL